ncbi:TPA: hypothetical protein RXP76_004954 [Escherichia coli]|nr:hypothetical protein [Escherichia coli]EGM8159073.1 hypothetical protein [Escherichia coli]MBS9032787.1 hypothetical protein [Escherichia coli]HEA6332416.1 hypothetical protein [Escherichia coli]HEA8512541.1 hypothetical protein [Escherichia coli]
MTNDIRQTHNAGEGPLFNRRYFIFTNVGCSFSFLGLDDVVFVGDAGVTVTDDISRALAFAIKWVAVGIAVSPILYGLEKLVIALKS